MATLASEQRELLLRIFADIRPSEIADAAYLFAETEPNQQSVFIAARNLVEQKRVRRILISDCAPKSGYMGAAAYRAAMIAAGIPAEVIAEVPMEPTEILHTAIEADRTIQFVKTKGYERLLVVSIPFHQERAFMSVVTAVLREHPSLKVYSHPGEPQPWDEVVTHSQGNLRGARAALIGEEQKRIETYTAQGYLLSRSAILEYLRTRDQA